MSDNSIVLGGRYAIHDRSMISGISEAESRKFKVVMGNQGRRWLYNDEIPGCGAWVYCEGGPGSKGFGGSTITFQLLEGGELSLKGPWHGNPDSMFRETGIDLRKRHITYGVIGENREYARDAGGWAITNVLYFDTEPQEGDFSRIEQLANEFAMLLGKEVAFYSETHGGSTNGFTHALKK